MSNCTRIDTGFPRSLPKSRARFTIIAACSSLSWAASCGICATLAASGHWILWPWLTEAGVVSATTCDAGLNYRDTPRLALKRFLDAEDVPHIRFEAELAGFKPLLRQVRERIRSVFGKGNEEIPALPRPM